MRPGAEPVKAPVEPFLRTWQLDATDPLWARRRAEWSEALLDGKLTLRDLLDATEQRYHELGQPEPSAFLLYVFMRSSKLPKNLSCLQARSSDVFVQRTCWSRIDL